MSFFDKTIGKMIDEPIKEVDKRYVPDNSDLEELERQRAQKAQEDKEKRKEARRQKFINAKDSALSKKGGSSNSSTQKNSDGGSTPVKRAIDDFEVFDDSMEDMKSVAIYRVNNDDVDNDEGSDFESGLGEVTVSDESVVDSDDTNEEVEVETNSDDNGDDEEDFLDDDDDDIEDTLIRDREVSIEDASDAEEDGHEDQGKNVIRGPEGAEILVPEKGDRGYDDEEVDLFIDSIREMFDQYSFMVKDESSKNDNMASIYQEEIDRLTAENNKYREMLSNEFSDLEKKLRGNLYYEPLSIRDALKKRTTKRK